MDSKISRIISQLRSGKSLEDLSKDLGSLELELETKKKEVFSQDDVDTFVETIREIGTTDEKMLKLYFSTKELDYEKLKENFVKSKEFDKGDDPLLIKIREVRSEMTELRRKKQKEEAELFRQEKERVFKEDKENVEGRLWSSLNEIVEKIPPVAKETGMNTLNSVKQYLSAGDVRQYELLESEIERLSGVDSPQELEQFKERLKRANLLE